DDLLLHLGEVGGVEGELTFLLGRLDEFVGTELVLCPCQWTGEARCNADGDQYRRFAHTLSSRDQTVRTFWAMPDDSQLVMQSRTASSAVCTRLKAAVLPMLPPS